MTRYLQAMSLELRVLGGMGQDNAALVQVNTGQARYWLLFDCGEGTLRSLEFSALQGIDHLFFSHLHMDHVSGFDRFFRANWGRVSRPNQVWGPAGTAQIMAHRFQGYLWNLHEDTPATWLVHDIADRSLQTVRFEAWEAFAMAHPAGSRSHEGVILQTPEFSVTALLLDHGTPSLGYVVREAERLNLEPSRMVALGLKPGPWVRQLKDPSPGQTSLEIDGLTHDLKTLRAELLSFTPGDCVAYLTDFWSDEHTLQRLEVALRGCRLLLCESQYRDADLDLAEQNFHMTARRAAELAARVGVQELVLFHVSQRYDTGGWAAMLKEAREVFANTSFPVHWQN